MDQRLGIGSDYKGAGDELAESLRVIHRAARIVWLQTEDVAVRSVLNP